MEALKLFDRQGVFGGDVQLREAVPAKAHSEINWRCEYSERLLDRDLPGGDSAYVDDGVAPGDMSLGLMAQSLVATENPKYDTGIKQEINRLPRIGTT